MERDVFINYVGMTIDEMKNLVIQQEEQLKNKLNGDITEQEKASTGFLLWNCKMLFRNIYMICNKLVNNYKNELNDLEFKNYSQISNIIKNEQEKWINLDNIKETLNKLYSIKLSDINNDNNNKKMIGEMVIDSSAQLQFYDKICEMLEVDENYLLNHQKRLENISATYYWNSEKGGAALIVADDGSYLGATSTIKFDEHLEKFKNGVENKHFNQYKILKLKCRSCDQEITIDCSKFPKNIKTLDTICPNCKAVIKYRNLNYVETQKNETSELKNEYNTFSISFINNYRFTIVFPYKLNELKRINNTTVLIGGKINIVYLTCPNINDFEKSAIEMFEKSAKNMNKKIHNYEKKYKIKNIDIIEKAILKDNVIQKFKFIYFNDAILGFVYNENSEISNVIDEAIKTIKILDYHYEKIERDPFKSTVIKD